MTIDNLILFQGICSFRNEIRIKEKKRIFLYRLSKKIYLYPLSIFENLIKVLDSFLFVVSQKKPIKKDI